MIQLLRKIKAKIFHYLPDSLYLRYVYWRVMGEPLHLKNPQTFNEKLQWLKLHDRNPLYTTLVDKYAVKKWVADKIGEQYIIPTLGVWNHFDEIDFDKLPNQFVLKATHDSGGLVICRNKKTFDKQAAREKLEKSLKNNFYYMGREWPYKNVPPRIIAEKYMEDEEENSLVDYKFYVFNGEPKFLYVSQGLENHATARISFLKMDWTFAPFCRMDYKPLDVLPKKPVNFKQMCHFVKILSKGTPFMRVDLYEICHHVYFSELTFYPCSGYTAFNPPQWDKKIGDWLKLPIK